MLLGTTIGRQEYLMILMNRLIGPAEAGLFSWRNISEKNVIYN